MTGPEGNSKFCFPETIIEVEGKQNSLFLEGPVIKCFVIPHDFKKMICFTPMQAVLAVRAAVNACCTTKTTGYIVFFFSANKNKDCTVLQ